MPGQRASIEPQPKGCVVILGLFTSALDYLGIPWTRSSKKIVSVYRKAATARLDEFVGPKC